MPPKFCVYSQLKEEDMDLALEVMGAKVRYGYMEEGEEEGEKEVSNQEEDTSIREKAELEAAKSRIPYDYTYKDLDMRRRRATDVKGNARVILPKEMSTKEESSLLVKIQELKKTYNLYTHNNCTKEGKQRTNLTQQQEEGLKSLQQRTKNRQH